jgi:catalase
VGTLIARADLFSESGKRTPMFVRFSTVAGERGSADTVRDRRGFAVKFYTEEGNWESAKITGANPDYHRRDLWEAIETGNFPEYEVALQVFTEEQAEAFSFDVLDATKLVPEALVPLRAVGKLTLNRNPDNFFAEIEQVAFCTAHVVPGIDFSNDPLLAGRIHSYIDTQITRLGGANFHELPINAPVAQVHNNQRDGSHRQAVARGRASYEPNSLGSGCAHQAGMAGFVTAAAAAPSRAQPFQDKLRGKPEKFADHCSQAQLLS